MLEPALVTVPDRAVPAEHDLNRTQCPSKHLVQTVGEVNGGRPLECRAERHAVDRSPAPCVHLEPRQDVLSDRPIDPPDLVDFIKK